MIDTPPAHGMFCLERVYPAAPARVFKAFADPVAKAKWFGGGEDWTQLERSLDFRVGGHERSKGARPDGTVSTFDNRYHEIIPDRRIVYVYEMDLNGTRISVSLATLEFRPEGQGTRLVVTEQGVFLNGYVDGGSREHGTAFLLDRLGRSLID